jgi:hypothetical protein
MRESNTEFIRFCTIGADMELFFSYCLTDNLRGRIYRKRRWYKRRRTHPLGPEEYEDDNKEENDHDNSQHIDAEWQ